MTNADGEFSYLTGERVTFTIGGIELGSATGAAQISPFNLINMEPITDELALRLELFTKNDVTDFDRAANIAFLLYSLDNDANPDNGLDITGWDSALAGAELGFNANLYKFASKFRRFAGANGINPNVTPMQPLSRLYKSLGLAVEVHLLTAVITDNNDDATDDSAAEWEHYTNGLTSSFLMDFDLNGNFEITEDFSYDGQGRVLTFNEVNDFDENGGPDSLLSRISTYNSNGDLATLVEKNDYDGDSNPDQIVTTTYVYDDLGQLQSYRDDIDFDADGNTDGGNVTTYTYDEAGNRLTEVSVADDGSVVTHTTYTYDADGNMLTWLREVDFGSDDVIEVTQGEIKTYDVAGNLLTLTAETDGDANGVRDSYSITTNTYDSMGNMLTSIFENYNDGVNVDQRNRHIYNYNGDGTLRMGDLYQDDSDLDGTYDGNDDYNHTFSYTYTAFGNWLTQRQEVDNDSDADIDMVNVYRHEYVTLSDGMFSLLDSYR